MPATVLAERVGWEGSITWFRDNIRRLRPEHRRPDPADRLTWDPGDAAQCDLWFPPRRIPLEDGSTALLPVLVITAAYSRFITGRMIPTRKTADLLLGVMGADPAAGPGATAADLGQRNRHRPRRPTRGRGERVHRDAGDQDRAAAVPGPRIQGNRGAAQRVL